MKKLMILSSLLLVTINIKSMELAKQKKEVDYSKLIETMNRIDAEGKAVEDYIQKRHMIPNELHKKIVRKLLFEGYLVLDTHGQVQKSKPLAQPIRLAPIWQHDTIPSSD